VARALHEGYRTRGHDAWLAVGRRAHGAGVVRLRNADGVRSRVAAWCWDRHDDLRERDRWRAALLARAPVAPGGLWRRWRGCEDFGYPSTRRLLDLTPTRPDVLQLHNLHGDYFDLRRLPELSAATRVVLTPHDAWLTTGHCAHSLDNDRWLVGCGRCPYLDIYPAVRRDGTRRNFLVKQAIFARSRVVAVVPSRWLLDRLERSLVAPALVDARVIPNGIDVELYQPGNRRAARTRLGLPADGRILLVAARNLRTSPWKDYETLVRALDGLDASVLVIALGERGTPESHGRSELRFVHDVPAADMATYLQAADAYLHPSRADTFPVSVLEALACGTPVIATAVGGIPEQVEDGRTGLLVPLRGAAALARAIERLLGDELLGARLGAAGADEARARFDVRDQVSAYLDWYAELVDSDAGAAQTT
jgi:glycosyltransferase involved in cell wall biosynthesis